MNAKMALFSPSSDSTGTTGPYQAGANFVKRQTLFHKRWLCLIRAKCVRYCGVLL